MNVATNRLIVALYVGVAIAVFTIAYFGYRVQVASMAALEEGRAGGSVSAGRLSTANRAAGKSSSDRWRVAEQMRTIAQLGALLQKKTADLQEQDVQLQHRTDEFKKLRDEADRYLATIYDLLQDSAPAIDSPTDVSTVSPNVGQVVGQVVAETDVLLSTELVTVQLELLQSKAEIAELEMAALSEHAKLTEATRAIVATGAPAVPTLVAVLTDESPELRAWAADTLGQMGPDAMDSIDALFVATEDEDANVRQSAHRALERIEESFVIRH